MTTRDDYNRNKEHYREYARNWYRTHRTECIERTKKWRKENPEKWKVQKKRNEKKYPEKMKKKSSRYQTSHREQVNEKARRWRKAHKEEISIRRRTRLLMSLYGLSEDDYNNMLKSQHEKCAICLKPMTNFKKRFAVDHDHKTGKIRGLLCDSCNRGIGLFSDDIDIFYRAIKYLSQ